MKALELTAAASTDIRHAKHLISDNSCTAYRANCIRCYSNTGIPGRQGPRKEKFALVLMRF